ncbi:CDP-alcohol phosphatidyltransferase family protein [Nonomuraea sp. NPDC059194]|uniref:CDP-alcohol phosphatidyltransferase family protein n=1 Tax=Nonomuraea sp. NPDC059194 TaxID=3346764 RepID=UPI00369E5D87
MRTYSLADVYATRKRRDSWWTVYFVDPVACRVALVVANRTRITPNALTVFSLLVGMTSAGFLAAGDLVAGAVLFYLSFMIDCVDGKVARLKGTGTPFGLWLDYVGDRIRVVCCAAGLAYGQYAATGSVDFILLGAAVAVLDLFRYVNAPQMKRVRETIREGIAASAPQLPAPRPHQPLPQQPLPQQPLPRQPLPRQPLPRQPLPDQPRPHHPAPHHPAPHHPAPHHPVPHQPVPHPGAEAPRPYVTGEPPSRPPRSSASRRRLLRRLNRALAKRRVRSHLISGIEFHAAVFVIAPVLGQGALIPITSVVSVLLLANEIFLVYRMWLFTRRNSAVPMPEESREHVLIGGSPNV